MDASNTQLTVLLVLVIGALAVTVAAIVELIRRGRPVPPVDFHERGHRHA